MDIEKEASPCRNSPKYEAKIRIPKGSASYNITDYQALFVFSRKEMQFHFVELEKYHFPKKLYV